MSLFIPDKMYFKIGEVSDITGVEQYVLRYWEAEFKLVKPYRTKSNQRLYRKKDVETILKIKELLYDEKLTIAGAKKKLKQLTPVETQLPIEFTQKDYKKIVSDIKTELEEIASIFSKN